MSAFSFYWHDYESFGTHPRLDRPSQFAGLRTNADLEPVGEPLVVYCQPPEDVLPHPMACLVTGITPQQARDRGIPEPDFIGRILQELGAPGTCGVGYNSLRFDDELTRHTAWRNFFDPYAREWQNGCSRWDLIDTVRLVYALRPDGIEWPRREDGAPSFRLEDLAAANKLVQTRAHDALSDVETTIALARLIRDRKPRLWEWVQQHRDKHSVRALLDPARPEIVLHVSQRFPAASGCISPILPLAPHPVNKNAVLCVDLRRPVDDLLQLPPEELADRLFTPAEDLPEGVERLPVKAVHLNRCPVLAPVSTLDAAAAQRLSLDMAECDTRARALVAAQGDVAAKLAALFAAEEREPASDAEQGLYDGFVSDEDRRICDRVRRADADALAALDTPFRDERLNEMLFRYRARHAPASLNEDEVQEWRRWCGNRLAFAPDGGLALEAYVATIDALRAERRGDTAAQDILDALTAWGQELAARYPA